MTSAARCLILACGNTLRSDDGIGPLLASWAEDRWRNDSRVRILCDHQWTPELAEEVAAAETVLFIDCSLEQGPGEILLRDLSPASLKPGLVTHHIGAAELLSLAQDLYGKRPRTAQLLTIGPDSIELGEGLSEPVKQALAVAQRMLITTVQCLLNQQPD
ncbi:hydrogenase maturation protease [Occallatibacter savannae]|uniref:hydrogenase maturation protease n=1 Tax=Occallatibacter savannae TaxID=1002691 RepID=UPI0013A57BD1|nr:hydrogenase maturation protease [Occallatibacter savannae]